MIIRDKNSILEELKVVAELGLTPSQISDLQVLRVQFEPRLKDIQKGLKDKTMTKEQASDELILMRAEFEEKAAGILTPEQMVKASKILDRYFASYGVKGSGSGNKQLITPDGGRYLPPEKNKNNIEPEEDVEEMPAKPVVGLGLLLLQRKLGLNDEQLAALAPVLAWLKDRTRELKDMRFDGKLTKKQLKEEFEDLKVELEYKLVDILTPEQIEKVILFVEKQFMGAGSLFKGIK